MELLSYSQAVELLRQKPENFNTPESLSNLLNNVDIQASGDITILYSGSYKIDTENEIFGNKSLKKCLETGIIYVSLITLL